MPKSNPNNSNPAALEIKDLRRKGLEALDFPGNSVQKLSGRWYSETEFWTTLFQVVATGAGPVAANGNKATVSPVIPPAPIAPIAPASPVDPDQAKQVIDLRVECATARTERDKMRIERDNALALAAKRREELKRVNDEHVELRILFAAIEQELKGSKRIEQIYESVVGLVDAARADTAEAKRVIAANGKA